MLSAGLEPDLQPTELQSWEAINAGARENEDNEVIPIHCKWSWCRPRGQARPGLVEACAVLIMNLKYHSLIAFLALVVCFAKETFDSRTWPSLLAYLLLGKIRPTSAGQAYWIQSCLNSCFEWIRKQKNLPQFAFGKTTSDEVASKSKRSSATYACVYAKGNKYIFLRPAGMHSVFSVRRLIK